MKRKINTIQRKERREKKGRKGERKRDRESERQRETESEREEGRKEEMTKGYQVGKIFRQKFGFRELSVTRDLVEKNQLNEYIPVPRGGLRY